jgi:hypothetical protein
LPAYDIIYELCGKTQRVTIIKTIENPNEKPKSSQVQLLVSPFPGIVGIIPVSPSFYGANQTALDKHCRNLQN